tara:strand:+ start:416 stop:1390 length:975 start_codon:yes stop_codon:yes gene_type:complete
MTAESGDVLLSICIVNWNTRDLLNDCLDSIYADPQASAWEVLVVDNASSDDSAEWVERHFPQVRLFASAANLGFSGGNNLALQEAVGRYFLLLNTDTRVEVGALGALVDFMEAHPRAGAVGPKLLNSDGSLQLSCGIAPSLRTQIIGKLLLHKLFPIFKLGRWDHAQVRAVGWVTGACLLIRRKVVEQIGLLDTAFYMYYEDLDWCLRVGKGGWDVFYYPFSRVVHLGGQSSSKNYAAMLVTSQQSLFYLFQKHFGSRHLFVLRLLTLIEMTLRSLLWGALFFLRPRRRSEIGQRLWAYRRIFYKSLMERSYWAPQAPQAPVAR